jgi:hypothetical protein
MNELADSLDYIARDAEVKLLNFSDAEAGGKTRGWSKKEILGHLVDSASNNHQRFVRMQLADNLSLPRYTQDEWVAVQAYGNSPWEDLVRLWSSYNVHLAQVIRNVRVETLGNRCSVGGGEPVTLQYLMDDYLVHLKHHLGQIFGENFLGRK